MAAGEGFPVYEPKGGEGCELSLQVKDKQRTLTKLDQRRVNPQSTTIALLEGATSPAQTRHVIGC